MAHRSRFYITATVATSALLLLTSCSGAAPSATTAASPGTLGSAPVTTEAPPPTQITGNLSAAFAAPAGYQWAAMDLTEELNPSGYPALAGLLVSYRAGYLQSTTGGPDAAVYLLQLNGPWTQPAIDAYLGFEGVAGGQTVSTPQGHTGKRAVGAFETTDAIAVFEGSIGVSVLTETGVDGAPLIDAFIAELG
ncbi:unannotated protein [freshwater metagenome]|uniref:Unannotated protein n=1 Tax=freshwater metagenome TaxID=449393 RepID=A0A6J7CFZ0_9ZZZZ|nr:hypothetical protein [Actinomycetota bacterium]